MDAARQSTDSAGPGTGCGRFAPPHSVCIPRSPVDAGDVMLHQLFTYDAFTCLIQTISAHQYAFVRFDQTRESSAGKLFYLRHDVDISPGTALQLGRIEKAESVQANFFFQINAETYSPFSRETIRIMEELRGLGHCVGLHIDASLIDPDEHAIRSTLEWFNRCITNIDFVVSFHRPAESVLLREFDGFTNVYSTSFFSSDRYRSDSRRNPDCYEKLDAWLAQGLTPLQLALHPIWWYPETDLAVLHQSLRQRRLLELDRYLLANFKTVFGGLIKAVACPMAP